MSHLPELPRLAIGARMSFNLATILTEATLAAPDAPACRFAGTTTTYRELDELSGRFAAGLREAGLAPGPSITGPARGRACCSVSMPHPPSRPSPARRPGARGPGSSGAPGRCGTAP